MLSFMLILHREGKALSTCTTLCYLLCRGQVNVADWEVSGHPAIPMIQKLLFPRDYRACGKGSPFVSFVQLLWTPVWDQSLEHRPLPASPPRSSAAGGKLLPFENTDRIQSRILFLKVNEIRHVRHFIQYLAPSERLSSVVISVVWAQISPSNCIKIVSFYIRALL